MYELLHDVFGDELLPPLKDDEIKIIENRYGFTIPPDLIELLQIGIPSKFYDWHGIASGDERAIGLFDEALFNLKEGIIFDVENNGYVNELSDLKLPMEERVSRVIHAFDEAPKMIPLHSHRFIPSYPCEAGNPIFSCHQTDIIVYGKDLQDYLKTEFTHTWSDFSIKDLKTIPYWTKMLFTNDI